MKILNLLLIELNEMLVNKENEIKKRKNTDDNKSVKLPNEETNNNENEQNDKITILRKKIDEFKVINFFTRRKLITQRGTRKIYF